MGADDDVERQKRITLYRKQESVFHYADVCIGELGVVMTSGVAGDDELSTERRLRGKDEDAIFEEAVARLRSEGYNEFDESDYTRLTAKVPVKGLRGREWAMKSWGMDYLLGEYLRQSKNGHYLEGEDDDKGDVIVQFALVVNPGMAAKRLPFWIEQEGGLEDVQVTLETSPGKRKFIWPPGFPRCAAT